MCEQLRLCSKSKEPGIGLIYIYRTITDRLIKLSSHRSLVLWHISFQTVSQWKPCRYFCFLIFWISLADLACSLGHIPPFTIHPCRWTNHPQWVLKRFIETKVPPGTPDAVMAQTGTEKKKNIVNIAKCTPRIVNVKKINAMEFPCVYFPHSLVIYLQSKYCY
jgi:hypothetical protein